MAIHVLTGAEEYPGAIDAGDVCFLVCPEAGQLCAAGGGLIPVPCASAAEQALLAEYIQTLVDSGMTAEHILRAVGAYRRRTHVLETGVQGLEGAVRRLRELGYAGGRILIACWGNVTGALELTRLLRAAFGSVDIQLRAGEGEQDTLQVGVVC